MAPIYTNNTNHTNDTDDTHHTDNPTTIGRETSPSSFFLRNKNLGQTIKTASRTRCRMIGHALPTIPAPLSPITAARSTRSPLPTPLVRNANVMPMRHHFAPAKPSAVFWKVLQNNLNLRAKTMNGMRKQNENDTRLLHGRAKVGEIKSNHCCGQREAFLNKKNRDALHAFEVILLIILSKKQLSLCDFNLTPHFF